MRRLGLWLVMLAIAMASACSVSVGVEKSEGADDRFDRVLSEFDEANAELQRGQVECNKGGSAQACGDSSLKIAELVDAYLPKIREAASAAPHRSHGHDFADALELYAKGLRERTHGLATKDQALFQSGNAKIESAGAAWQQARAELQAEASQAN